MNRYVRLLAWTLGVCAAALLVLSGSGCSDAGPLQPTPRETYTVSGIVSGVAGDLAGPVEGAHVEDANSHVFVKTGADGSYIFRDVGEGEAYIFVEKEGFRRDVRRFTLTGDTRLDIQLVRQ